MTHYQFCSRLLFGLVSSKGFPVSNSIVVFYFVASDKKSKAWIAAVVLGALLALALTLLLLWLCCRRQKRKVIKRVVHHTIQVIISIPQELGLIWCVSYMNEYSIAE